MERLISKIRSFRGITSFKLTEQWTLSSAVTPRSRIRYITLRQLPGEQKTVSSFRRLKLYKEIVAETMANREKRYLTDPNAQPTFHVGNKMHRASEKIDAVSASPNTQMSISVPPIPNPFEGMCEMQRSFETQTTMPIVENLIGVMSCEPATTTDQAEAIANMNDVPLDGNGIDPCKMLDHAEDTLHIPLKINTDNKVISTPRAKKRTPSRINPTPLLKKPTQAS
ncbi:hypothetical protein QAD02_018276 [Eretmocerus hayati]|uniref:Uncharacterized protein n=1 Tax=Eretmocerus hayati TaxID=131215 RepID=A0ACC2PGQ0_9HYME|nr:hypothetical protein QAD02_018276 [Eretmocerus hayati]